MASLTRLTTLSNEIAEKTKIITNYLSSKGLDAASFDVDGLDEHPISPTDEVEFQARLDLIAATKELNSLALGPKERLRTLAFDCIDQLSLQAVWTFKVAEAVPLSEPISYEQAAKRVQELTGTYVPMLNLRRLIRHAITNQIFCEPSKGFVAHNRTSRLLLEDAQMNAWVGLTTSDLLRLVANVVEAMKRWPGSEEPAETGVNIAYSQDMKWFDFIQKDQELSKRYNKAMEAHGSGNGFELSHTVDSYPWGDLGEGIVVDLGGNQGYASFAIAEAFPSLKFVVQDTAGMRTAATIAAVPYHLKSRVDLTVHDFFTPQPVVADVYFFRWIFHGFSDKYAIQILQALIPALKKGARVLINDGTMSDPGTVGYVEEKSMRTMDVLMQVTVNAREREVDDWAELFRRADERYQFLKAWKSPKSRMWMIEAEWAA